MSTNGDTATAEEIFDAIADSAKAPAIDDVTEDDRIEDERFVVEAFEAAVSGHAWESSRECATEEGRGEVRKESAKWSVGDRCCALYAEDRVEYPAVVRAVKAWKETCVVEFDVYGNEEEVAWSDMKKSGGGGAKTKAGRKRKI